uniref:Uncharacterized protein n=1 Tax=Anguilla anguilla TaxID=7936 RepID=A0A0E9UBX1_ANGAN
MLGSLSTSRSPSPTTGARISLSSSPKLLALLMRLVVRSVESWSTVWPA